ncbi:hypothetical protein H9P43_007764 [Blastocladiella emersonii ATCC 22665]|nr:hypothetical protein H9P43_007764 [Blastocladiella emersonii ATCC 22665]
MHSSPHIRPTPRRAARGGGADAPPPPTAIRTSRDDDEDTDSAADGDDEALLDYLLRPTTSFLGGYAHPPRPRSASPTSRRGFRMPSADDGTTRTRSPSPPTPPPRSPSPISRPRSPSPRPEYAPAPMAPARRSHRYSEGGAHYGSSPPSAGVSRSASQRTVATATAAAAGTSRPASMPASPLVTEMAASPAETVTPSVGHAHQHQHHPAALPVDEMHRKRYTAKLERDKKALLDHVAHAATTAQSLSALLAAAHTENDRLLKTVEDRERRAADLQRLVARHEREMAALSAKVNSSKDETARAVAVAEKMRQVEKKLHAALTAREADLDAARRETATWQHRVRDLESALADAQRVAATIRDSAAAHTDQVADLERELAAQSAKLSAAAAARVATRELWRRAASLLADPARAVGLSALDLDAAHDSEDETVAEHVVAWLARVAEGVQAATRAAAEATAAANTDLAGLRVQCADLDAALTQTRASLAETLAERDAARADLAALADRLEAATSGAATAETRYAGQLDAARAETESAISARDVARAESATSAAELANVRAAHARVAGDLAMCKKLLEHERAARRESAGAAAELAAVRNELARAVAERDADRAALAEEQARRRAEAAQWMQSVMDAQREVAAARDAAAAATAEKRALEVELGVRAAVAVASATAAVSRPGSPVAGMVGVTSPARKVAATGAGYDAGSTDALSSTIARLQQRMHKHGGGSGSGGAGKGV